MRTSTPVVIIKLEHEGICGYGEASMPPYLGESHETVMAFLEQCKPMIEEIKDPGAIAEIIAQLDKIAKGNTAAKASIDIALHDLKGKMDNQPCWKLFGAEKEDAPFTTFTIGIDEPEVIIEKLKEATSFKTLKIKLDGEHDRLLIDTIRSVTNQPIAVDVNQGWKSKEHALKMIEWLAGKNVLFIEQPLPKEDHDSANWLYMRSPLPIFGDESIQRYDDIDRTKDCFHGINIKLMKCTGMYEAHRMIRRARELELKILIGCMSETSCAISAASQLSPLVDYADLDGALLVKNDLFEGTEIIKGKITLSERCGNGAIQRGEGVL